MGHAGDGGSLCDSEERGVTGKSVGPDIINGFERKSVALLDYVSNLEAQLEHYKLGIEHREGRLNAEKKALEEDFARHEAKLRAEKRALEEKLHLSLNQLGCAQKAIVHQECKWHVHEEALRNLKLDMQATQDLLQNERQRSKELESQLADIKEQFRMREQAHNRRRIKDEMEKAKLEEEITTLKKKVTLGWILGCLSEVYLRLDSESEPEKGLQVMGQLFKDDDKPDRLEAIEREVYRLISSQSGCHHHQKDHATSLKKVQGDLVLGSRRVESDVQLDSAIMVATCPPIRNIRTVMDMEHEHHQYGIQACYLEE